MKYIQYRWKDYNYRYVFTFGRMRKYIITLWCSDFSASIILIARSFSTIADDQSNYLRKLYSSYVMI